MSQFYIFVKHSATGEEYNTIGWCLYRCFSVWISFWVTGNCRHTRKNRLLKVNRKYLTDLREASISSLAFRMNLSSLVLLVRSSPEKFRSTERETLAPYSCGNPSKGPLFLFWWKDTGSGLYCAEKSETKVPLSSVKMAGNAAPVDRSPLSDKISLFMSHRKL